MQKIRLLLIGLFVFALAIIFINNYQLRPGWDFRNNLWAPANLMVNSLSPYRIDVLFDGSNAIWMPMIIGDLFLFGYLPLQIASNLWLIFNIIALILVVVFSIDHPKANLFLSIQLILLMIFFPSLLSLFLLGQISLITCLVLLIVIKFDHRIHPFIIGLLLAFSLAKPQISFLFIFTYVFISSMSHGKKYALILLIYVIVGIILGCLPLFFFHPAWIPDFVNNILRNANWAQPTLYSHLLGSSSQINFIIKGLFLIAGVVISFILSMKFPKRTALLWSLALTTIFSFYIWSWDFVLLIPIFIHLLTTQQSNIRKAILFIGYAICVIIFIYTKITMNASDEINWWIPLFMVSIMIISSVEIKNATIHPANSPISY